MNLRQKIILGLLLYVVLSSAVFAQVIEIPDSNLQQAVRETLNLPAGAQITQADMRQFTQLDVPRDRQIRDLVGLEYATNLTYLALGGNEITDLTPIAGLVKLEHLWAWVNPISDLSPLTNLTELKALDFGYCNTISDISPIANLTNLTLLQLRGNRIVDISPLENLTQLVTLRLNDNQIADIGPLENLSELTELHLHNNQIVDVSPLANLTKLTELLLNDNRIVDDSPLANLANLEHLEIHNNPIFDPDSPLVEISDPNLRQAVSETLYLPANASITQANMRQLTKLDVPPDSQVRDLAGLEYATNLTYLAMGGNEITDLTPIAGLVKLRFLSVWGSPISDLSPITNLTELAHLYLGYCRTVSDIVPVANLTNLTFLQLSGNQVVDISPLENLTNLTELQLEHNRIVHVAPLANLTNLEALQIHINAITDYSPLDGLSLTHFTYDESCEMLPIPLRPRLADRNFPSIFAAWNWRPVNRPHLSYVEGVALHDLYFTERFGLELSYAEHGVIVRGYLNEAQERRDRFAVLNPNIVFLIAVHIRDAFHGDSPDASPYAPYWVRDAAGNPVPGWLGTYLVDFTDPGAQQLIVDQAAAVSKCGLYDGIFLDWWREDTIVLKGHRSFEAEQRARDAIIQRIRAEVRPDFLIMVNSNYSEIPRSAPYVNGIFMETGTPDGFRGEQPQGEELEWRINKIESTLHWAEENLREPQINGLEGWGLGDQPPDSPANLRWMRAFTTMSLTLSDGYVLLNRGRAPGEQWHTHEHHWYNFWDADLGRPVGAKSQLYDADVRGLYIREFTNGWAVYNHSGSAQVVTLPEEVRAVASGLVNTEHALPNLDGEMYLRVKPADPADVNGDGVVNVFDLTIVAQGLGTDNLKADVNGDGVVNVFDLVFVANQF
ncbi:MAG: leucine-rich repeat domain-containing protein [Candidatus Poribacteria bacterium]|nr:leucine-rich repeat domain-containing protein [Candidatus Poribacteria bacterium]